MSRKRKETTKGNQRVRRLGRAARDLLGRAAGALRPRRNTASKGEAAGYDILTSEAAERLGWDEAGTLALDQELKILRGPTLTRTQRLKLGGRIMGLVAQQARRRVAAG